VDCGPRVFQAEQQVQLGPVEIGNGPVLGRGPPVSIIGDEILSHFGLRRWAAAAGYEESRPATLWSLDGSGRWAGSMAADAMTICPLASRRRQPRRGSIGRRCDDLLQRSDSQRGDLQIEPSFQRNKQALLRHDEHPAPVCLIGFAADQALLLEHVDIA